MSKNENLYAAFQAAIAADPTAIVIETPDGRRTGGAELDDLVARYAGALRQAGVMPGERVAAQIDTSPENIALYLATLKLGAIFLPLNTAYTGSEIAYFLGDATPAVFVVRPQAEAASMAAAHGVRSVLTLGTSGDGSLAERARAAAPIRDIAAVAADDVAAILYTSGTTGRSKGAMLTHGNLAANARTLHRAWGFVPGDVLLHALPLYHIHGLFVAVNLMLLNGGKILLLPKFDAALAIRWLPQASVFMGVPTYYTRLLSHDGFTRETARRVRLFVSGSAPLLAETFDAFERRTGHRILERYGMSETGMNCSNPLLGDRRPGTVGPALSGVEVRIADKSGRAVGAGEIGVIEVRGANVFKGYWNMPEKTATEFRGDGFFVTGDLGTMDRDGYVTIVGRDKDLVISGGLNVYPKEVEDVLNALPGIVESAVIGLPHADFGEAVAAVVVRDGVAPLDEAQTIRAAGERLAKFKLPKAVFFVEDLPRNAMGKVQKNVLRDRYRDRFSAKRFG